MKDQEPIVLPHTVPVLRQDISEGIQENCQECVIARAIRRTVPHIKGDHLSVQGDLVFLYQFAYELPPEVVQFIKRFDEDAEVDEWQHATHNERIERELEDPTLKYDPFEFQITDRSFAYNRSTNWAKNAKEIA